LQILEKHNQMNTRIITSAIAILLIALSANAQNAKEIIQKMDNKLQGNSNKSVMKMSIVRPKYTRTIEFKNWSLGRNYFMTYVTAPAKDKGQVFMKYNTEMWSYSPAINRMIKLPPSMMSQGWMGSDYSNDDLVKQSSIVDDYTHTIIGNETIDGIECTIIEMIPNADANIVWGKIIIWVNVQKYINLKAQYYDEENYLVRTETASKIKTFDSRELPSVIEILPHEEPHNKTIIEIVSMEFDIEIEENFFSQQNMKRIR